MKIGIISDIILSPLSLNVSKYTTRPSSLTSRTGVVLQRIYRKGIDGDWQEFGWVWEGNAFPKYQESSINRDDRKGKADQSPIDAMVYTNQRAEALRAAPQSL